MQKGNGMIEMQKTYIELAIEAEKKIKQLQAQLIDVNKKSLVFHLSELENSYKNEEDIIERNTQIRAMIAELTRQKQYFEKLRGERVQNKKWFMNVPLSSLEKRIFLSIYEQQKSFRQVSNEMNCNVEDIKKNYKSAMNKIKKYLREEGSKHLCTMQ